MDTRCFVRPSRRPRKPARFDLLDFLHTFPRRVEPNADIAARSGFPANEPSAAGFSARLAALQRGRPAQARRLRRAGANGTQRHRGGTRAAVSKYQSRLGCEGNGSQSVGAGAGVGPITDRLCRDRDHPAHRVLERLKPAADSQRGPAQGTRHPLRARLDPLAACASVVQREPDARDHRGRDGLAHGDWLPTGAAALRARLLGDSAQFNARLAGGGVRLFYSTGCGKRPFRSSTCITPTSPRAVSR